MPKERLLLARVREGEGEREREGDGRGLGSWGVGADVKESVVR